jgi:hypothetical protein
LREGELLLGQVEFDSDLLGDSIPDSCARRAVARRGGSIVMTSRVKVRGGGEGKRGASTSASEEEEEIHGNGLWKQLTVL